VSVTGILGDGSFTLGVDTGSDVQDLVGNALASSVTSESVFIDNTAPTFDNIAALPSSVQAGQTVSITFDASETLAANPTVTVNTNSATFVSVLGLSYAYSYTVLGSDPIGAATIEIMGQDLASNIGLVSDNTALTIVDVPGVPLAAWPGIMALAAAGALVLRRRKK
jgi:hypothetical protein